MVGAAAPARLSGAAQFERPLIRQLRRHLLPQGEKDWIAPMITLAQTDAEILATFDVMASSAPT